jgi:hypothetical protein
VQGLRPSGLTTSGASRASYWPAVPAGAPDVATVQYERHRPEQTTSYRLVQQHAVTFFAHADAEACADLPQFVKDAFDAFLERGFLAHGFLCMSCGAFSVAPAAGG